MAGADLLTVNGQTGGMRPAGYGTTKSNVFFGSLYSSSLDSEFGFRRYLRSKALADTRAQIKQITGEEPAKFIQIDKAKYPNPNIDGRIKGFEEALDAYIIKQRTIDPRYNTIRTLSEIDRDIQTEAKFAREYVAKQTAGEGIGGVAIGFAGGVIGSFTDPINAASMFMGFGESKSVLSYMAREAALNAVIETAQIPGRIEWENKLGYKYGIKEAASDVALAGFAGGVFAGLSRGVSGAVKKAYNFSKRRSVGQEVFDAVAMDKSIPVEFRENAANMSRIAHIDENNPIDSPRLDDVIVHRKNMIETEAAFKENRNPEVSGVPIIDPLIARAQAIRASIDAPIKTEKDILGYSPKSLARFIKESGGIQDYSGELKARDITNKSLVGLVRKDKAVIKTPQGEFVVDNTTDYVKQRVFEAGYFPDKNDYNDISDSELYDAIARDVGGDKIYNMNDRTKLQEAGHGVSVSDMYAAMGIDSSMSDVEIADRLKELSDPDIPPKIENYSADFDQRQELFDSPEYQAAIEADFYREMGNRQNMSDFFFLDDNGNNVSYDDFMSSMKDDEDILTAIKTCALG